MVELVVLILATPGSRGVVVLGTALGGGSVRVSVRATAAWASSLLRRLSNVARLTNLV